MLDDGFLHDGVGFRDEGDSARSVRVVQGIGNFAQAIEALLQRVMVLPQGLGGYGQTSRR